MQDSQTNLIDQEITKLLKESEQIEEEGSLEYSLEQSLDGEKSDTQEIYVEQEIKHNPIDKKNEHRCEESPNNLKKTPGNISELQFIRLLDPIHIPSYLVEQIKDKDFDTEKFYAYQKLACVIETPSGPTLNMFNFLYALTNSRLRQVKGFCHMVLDLLTNTLEIKQFSIDREYWNKGDSMSLIKDKGKKMMKDLSIRRIMWSTKNSRYCEALGFKKAKESIMIYEE